MPSTDYVRHAARMARQLVLEAGPGGTPAPTPEFYTTLAKALEQMAEALEQTSRRRD